VDSISLASIAAIIHAAPNHFHSADEAEEQDVYKQEQSAPGRHSGK